MLFNGKKVYNGSVFRKKSRSLPVQDEICLPVTNGPGESLGIRGQIQGIAEDLVIDTDFSKNSFCFPADRSALLRPDNNGILRIDKIIQIIAQLFRIALLHHDHSLIISNLNSLYDQSILLQGS